MHTACYHLSRSHHRNIDLEGEASDPSMKDHSDIESRSYVGTLTNNRICLYAPF